MSITKITDFFPINKKNDDKKMKMKIESNESTKTESTKTNRTRKRKKLELLTPKSSSKSSKSKEYKRTIVNFDDQEDDQVDELNDDSNIDYKDYHLKNYKNLEEALLDVFKYPKFRNSLQQKIIENILENRSDIFISMPTGAGKSLLYQLPAIYKNFQQKLTIIISPLLSLINDQLKKLQHFGIKCATLNSQQTLKQKKFIESELLSDDKHNKIKLLFITPEMFNTDYFKENLLEKLINEDKLLRVVIDEAHCIIQWGYNFRKSYLKLADEIKLKYPRIQWIAMTATINSKDVEHLVEILKFRKPILYFFMSNFRKNLYYDIVYKDLIDKPLEHLRKFIFDNLNDNFDELLLDQSDDLFTNAEKLSKKLSKNDNNNNNGHNDNDQISHNNNDNNSHNNDIDVGIVYCRTREQCDELADYLCRTGIKCKSYHSGLSKSQRLAYQNRWLTGQLKLLIATISFGMGIDKSNVRFVVHWTVSQSLINYYQESGRAGRDGNPSHCRIYYSLDDCKKILFLLRNDIEQKRLSHNKNDNNKDYDEEIMMKNFQKIVNYCENYRKCRHLILLSEFVGDSYSHNGGQQQDSELLKNGCGTSCDVCTDSNQVKKFYEQFQLYKSSSNTMTGSMIRNPFYNDNTDDGDGCFLKKYDVTDNKDEKIVTSTSSIVTAMDIVRNEFKKRKILSTDQSFSKQSTFTTASKLIQKNQLNQNEVNDEIREMYCKKFSNELENHLKSLNKDLSKELLKKITKEKELEIYRKNNNRSIYRSKMAQLFKQIRDATKSMKIVEFLKQYSI